MSSVTGTRLLKLLLVASDDQVRGQLRTSLSAHYDIATTPDSHDTFSIPQSLPRFDIILIVRKSMSHEYLNSLKQTFEAMPSAVAVFVENDPERLAATAIRYGIASYVVDGYELNRVPTVIELSLERFRLQQALQDELQKSQEELAARKIIERAKGLLMDKKDLNEQDAYRSLRELAMRQSKSIKEVSETLILYSDILP